MFLEKPWEEVSREAMRRGCRSNADTQTQRQTHSRNPTCVQNTYDRLSQNSWLQFEMNLCAALFSSMFIWRSQFWLYTKKVVRMDHIYHWVCKTHPFISFFPILGFLLVCNILEIQIEPNGNCQSQSRVGQHEQ